MRSISEAERLFQGELVAMPRPDCLRLLAISRIGRVAYNAADGPVVLPVNGRAQGTDVFLCLRAGSEVAEALADAPAAYQIDGFDDFHQVGWSVLLRGPARQVTEEELPEYLCDWPLPWVAGKREVWVRIAGAEITGRRLLP